jgi:plastocyanin
MKYRLVPFFMGIVLLSIANSCSSPDEKKATEQESARAIPVPNTYTVEIRQMKFSPEVITVKKGDKIVFVNHDMVNHDITEEGKAWSSSTLEPEKSWALTATESQNYYCSLHVVMKGKIIVK